MFGITCCCSSAKDGEDVVFFASTDEDCPALPHQMMADSKKTQAYKADVRTAPPPLALDSDAEKKRAARKAILQRIVRDFVKRAAHGSPCVYIDEGSCLRSVSRYYLDKKLDNLTITSDGKHAHAVCPLRGIEGVYAVGGEDGISFPEEMLASLNPMELERLVMVAYRSAAGELQRCHLLEASQAERDTFMDAIKVLQVYADSAPKDGGNSRERREALVRE